MNNIFQNNNPQGGGIFGGANPNTTQTNLFGGGAKTGLFNQPSTIPATGLFNQTPQQPQQGLFTQQNQQTTQGVLFNQQTQPTNQGGMFTQQGQQNQGGFLNNNINNGGGMFQNQGQAQNVFQQPQQQQQQQQQLQQQPVIVNSNVWREMKEMHSRLSLVKKEQISVERDINVSDNNNKYAHKLITTLPQQLQEGVKTINQYINEQGTAVTKLVESQKELLLSIQETRKEIQSSSLGLKQTAQQVKDIQETVNELITEQQDQKQYITNFFYPFINYLENRQFPRIVLPQPFVIKTQEKFQMKIDKLQRQIEEVEQMLQVEIMKRNDEEELAFIFVIVEQLFKYFNNVTALIYDFHKHYESFRMKIVHFQDQRQFGFAQDLNESTKQALNEENRYFKQLSIISENLEKQIRKHEEELQQRSLPAKQ